MDAAAQQTGRIRPAVDDDLEAICALDARVYPAHHATPGRVGFMKDVLFSHPWRTDRLPSLVYEDAEGRIRGFLGVMPRRFTLNNQPLLAGITHRFMVDAEIRGSLAALGLMKTFLQSGEHDLAITEPENEAARRIWQRYGGYAVESQSLQWMKPIRPAGWAAQYAEDRVPAPVKRVVEGLAGGVDAVAGPLAGLRPSVPDGSTVELSPATMAAVLGEATRRFSVRPTYETSELGWFLDRLAGKRGRGELRSRLVTTAAGEAAGYFLYYVRPRGTGLVVQICARPDRMKTVWRHLLDDAWRSGTVALRGKYDVMAASIPDRSLLIRRARHTFMLHARNADAERAVLRGDAFISRLEGEGGIPFGDEPGADSGDGANGA